MVVVITGTAVHYIERAGGNRYFKARFLRFLRPELKPCFCGEANAQYVFSKNHSVSMPSYTCARRVLRYNTLGKREIVGIIDAGVLQDRLEVRRNCQRRSYFACGSLIAIAKLRPCSLHGPPTKHFMFVVQVTHFMKHSQVLR